MPEQIEERIDDMLEDFRKCIRWIEAAGRQELIAHLTPANFNTRRVITTMRRLHSMAGAFVSAYQQRYGEGTAQKKPGPQLPGSSKLLKDLRLKK